jgi:hypothetical protein
MSDEQPKRGALPWWIWAAAFLPMVYLLSVGPVVAVATRLPPGARAPDALLALYAPVDWLHRHTPPQTPSRVVRGHVEEVPLPGAFTA